MEIGKLDNTQRAEKLHPRLTKLFEFIKANDFNKLPNGKIEVDGDDIFVMNLDIQGTSQDTQPIEMHRVYIDVHILLNGNEKIGWKPIDEIAHYTQVYDETGDCALSDDSPRFYVELHPGEYCIVFPEDTHAPAISSGKIRKLIGKVKI